MDWEIKMIEELPETTREQAAVRERYWYEIKKPFYNNQVPGRSKQEYKKAYNQTPEYKAKNRIRKQAYRAKKKLFLEQE